MRPRLIALALMGAALTAARAPAANAPETSAADDSFPHTRARIEHLFQDRDAPPALPRKIINPFVPASMRLADADARKTIAAPTDVISDNAMLERVAPAVQIQGIIQVGGRPSLIINRKPFTEGDHLTVMYGTIPVVIVIKKITRETFTLGYGDATLTLSLPR